jgi:hypothetical protein
MNNILSTINKIDLLTWLWLFVIAFALHEVEEWNILRWYQRNFVDLPPSNDKSVRVWIIFVILIGFVWSAVATLPRNPVFAVYVLLPAIAVAIQNALQHVYWFFFFKQYTPGIITSVFLLIPFGVYLIIRVVWQNLVPLWYVGILILLLIPGLVQTVQAKNRMTKQIRAIHRLGIKLAGLLEH